MKEHYDEKVLLVIVPVQYEQVTVLGQLKTECKQINLPMDHFFHVLTLMQSPVSLNIAHDKMKFIIQAIFSL